MTDTQAGASQPRRPSRTGRLVSALVAIAVLMAMVAVGALAQRVEPPATNPPLQVGCGLKVMLVLDESQSIHAFNAVEPTRSAARGFVEALEDTGSPVALAAFQSHARRGPVLTGPTGYAEVTSANRSTFINWINGENGGYNPPANATGTGGGGNNPNGTTNWEDAFDQVDRTPGGPPNLVVFVTDGNPNTVNVPGNSGQSTAGNTSGVRFTGDSATGRDNATAAAVPSANDVKRAGARIFGIFVGPDTAQPGTAARLQQVTGPTLQPNGQLATTEGTDPRVNDYDLVDHFATLREELSHLVGALCGSGLTITKFVPGPDDSFTPAPGWTFTAGLDSPHNWLVPAIGTRHSATLTTGDDGEVRFSWRLPSDESRAVLTPSHERLRPGYEFLYSTCETHRRDGGLDTHAPSTTRIPGATLGREDWHTCEVFNVRARPGDGGGEGVPGGPHLSVTKRMPAHTTVGAHVSVAITVKNTGHATAHHVQVHETPAPGGHVVSVGNHGSVGHDGTVLWNIGSLAPGHSRTVHATVRFTRPGSHLNTAVAAADRVFPGFSIVRGAARVRPRFTG